MKMRCPHCRARGEVDLTMGGRVVRCPRCSELFRIPVPLAPRSAESVAHASPVDPEKSDADRFPAAPVTAPGSIHRVPPDTSSESPRQPTTGNQDEDSADLSELDLQDISEPKVLPMSVEVNARSSEALPASAADEPVISECTTACADRLPAPVDGQQSAIGSTTDFPDLSAQSVAWEEVLEVRKDSPVAADEQRGIAYGRQEPEEIVDTEQVLEEELAALLSETCSICGRTVQVTVSADSAESRVCDDCRYNLNPKGSATIMPLADDRGVLPPSVPFAEQKGLPGYTPDNVFSAMAVLKAAWAMVSGVKIPIWIGILSLLAILAGVEAVSAVFVPSAVTFGGEALVVWVQILTQVLETVFVLTVLAGLYAIGVRRVSGVPFSWRTVFSGFPHLGQIAVAGFLMSLLIISGFFLLVLPGIYLAVGYSLTLPLMVEKGYGPWQAMESSRRIIHRKWWQVFGLYLIMYLIYLVSCVPFGIGLVWTIPMLFTLTGVLYRTLVPESGSR
jgi:predicted Zn finger-like uncharacterized protein